MNISVSFDTACKEYLIFCKTRKNLDYKTLKAYSIDLKQFADFISKYSIIWYEKKTIEFFIKQISERYKPKTVKRKIASLKAFFRYLEIEEILDKNPFHKIQVKYKEPFLLPKTIPLNVIEDLIRHSYQEQYKSKTLYS